MARWTTVVAATSISLLLIAGASRVPSIAQRLDQGQDSIIGLTGIGGLAGAGTKIAPQQPFTAVTSPAWSNTGLSVTRLQEWLKGHPDDPRAATMYAQLGSLYLQQARETGDPSYYPRAEGALETSLRLDPENVVGLVGVGTLQLARHDFAAALATGQRARELAPNAYVVHGIIGDAAVELGRYDAAIDAFQQMVDLRPDLASYSRVSYARELHGDLSGAIEAMQQAVSAGTPRSEATSWARVQLGHLYFSAGELDQAERQYQLTLRVLPNYVHGLGGLARVAAARGNLKAAAAQYEAALKVAPLPEYAIALGDIYRVMGDHAAAAKQDQLVRVIAELQRGNGMDVDLEMALFEADHATEPAAMAAALAGAQATYGRRPSVHAADALAWTLYRAGRAAEALPYAREALRLGTQDPLLRFHAGAISAAAGQPAEARGYLEAAVQQNPAFSVRYAPEAQRLLAQLKGSAG
ncbi:MAG: tetratricopeptide repeat protein [Chloroflexota bacterium]